MKKSIKLLIAIIFVSIVFLIGNKVEANSIQGISMDIYVDSNGDAHVTETWNCKVNEGTEVYHPYYNLGKSEIKDLTVTDGNTQYETISYWSTSGSLESKANKCGIHRISNGIELCWGMSNYGTHTYIAKYTITNFVAETTDAQMIYWTLIPYEFSNKIGRAYIKIHTDFDIADTTDVWGYGNYGGTAYVYDGYIEMESKGALEKNEYMTILVKFPQNSFDVITNKLNYSFDHYLDMAEVGAKHHKSDIAESIVGISIYFFKAVMTFICFTLIISVIAIKLGPHSSAIYGLECKNLPSYIDYYRDIPCRNDIYRAYYIGYQYGIIKNKTDLLGAIILKWLKNGMIRIEERETGLIFKKENTVIVLNETNPEIFMEKREKELFNMLYVASKDGYLENKEFEKWCGRSYSKILSWFDKIMADEEDKLIKEGLIEEKEIVTLKIFKSKQHIETLKLRKEAIELEGLKKYLKDYTLIKERKALEVHLFEDYLIFAQIMGIAKTVAKQFKDLYPEIAAQSKFTSYDYIMYVNISSNNGITAARTAKSRAERYSSGGGGFSSGGGGGGSFGGGGGGGGFR